MKQAQGILAFTLWFLIVGSLCEGEPDPNATPAPNAAEAKSAAGVIEKTLPFNRGNSGNASDPAKCGLKDAKFTFLNTKVVKIEGLSFTCSENDTCTEIYFTVGTSNMPPMDNPEGKGYPSGHKIPNQNKTCGSLKSPFTSTTPLEITLPEDYTFGNKTNPTSVDWFSVYCWDSGNSFDLGRAMIPEIEGLAEGPKQSEIKLPTCDDRDIKWYVVNAAGTIESYATATTLCGLMTLIVYIGQ